ncbi:hypothetical protein C1646_769934 [Rhizophagus diaphanus]|nr:hypothetical protein C1646_769934 [Rhizophagus diaphanus] [Rhizophagus sp. MUCL 43196]
MEILLLLAVDYIEWSTKSTNRIDYIIKLTPEGDEYVRQIEAVRVISELKLSWLKKENPLRVKIIGSHLPINALTSHTPIITKLNLSRQTRYNFIIIRKADHKIARYQS